MGWSERKSSFVKKDVAKQTYRSSDSYTEQFNPQRLTEQEVDDVVAKPESEMASPYKSPNYAELEYDLNAPSGFSQDYEGTDAVWNDLDFWTPGQEVITVAADILRDLWGWDDTWDTIPWVVA